MNERCIGDIQVCIILGPYDDSRIRIAVKSEIIPMGLDAGGILGGGGTIGGFGITIKEATKAENVLYWPRITLEEPNRRTMIFDAARGALEKAERLDSNEIGFFTLGLEVSRIPSWEIAEEIAKAVYMHSQVEHKLKQVVLVASSPTQVSSFHFAIDNIRVITS
ncbi:MAG: hypothetical protein EAX95_07705 [Candidatus Thorarchaeota archaeon]|nr:hypothetical protein [Candidatus Thorarchaeota archaeon]